MVAMECVDPATQAPDSALVARIQKEALQRGLLLLSCGQYGNVIRFLYPLTIPDAQFDAALETLADAMFAAADAAGAA
ncbi:4-aminobutyrate aminotransferase PuuE [compost metagenome]